MLKSLSSKISFLDLYISSIALESEEIKWLTLHLHLDGDL